MTTKPLIATSLLALAALTLHAEDEAAEPPLRVQLELGDVEQEVELGESFELTLGGETYRGRLTAASTRTLDRAGVRFEYPSSFTYAYEDDPSVTIFTVEGPNTTLMLQVYPAVIEAEELLEVVVESAAEQYGELDARRGEGELELGGASYATQTLSVDMGMAAFTQDFVAIPGEETVKLLLVQCMLDDERELTEESREVLELLATTFEID